MYVFRFGLVTHPFPPIDTWTTIPTDQVEIVDSGLLEGSLESWAADPNDDGEFCK